MIKKLLSSGVSNLQLNFAILIGRVSFGVAMLTHGWPKLANYSAIAPNFPDPIGVGSELSLALAVFSEFFCSILLILGLGTRLALIPLLITMMVAFFIHHAGDAFGDKELSFLFMFGFLVLYLTGPGKFSLDHKIFGSK
ncbi:MAG: DoxX family protein [Saprospirales bacterium]|nr:MAG: DoxX family protein [Saprospirales bacterium]